MKPRNYFEQSPSFREARIDREPVENYFLAEVGAGPLTDLKRAYGAGETLRWSCDKASGKVKIWHHLDGTHRDIDPKGSRSVAGYLRNTHGFSYQDFRETSDQEKELIEQAIITLLFR